MGGRIGTRDIDWAPIRQALEEGMSVDDAARHFGVSRAALNNRVRAHDWGGQETRRRRTKTVRMLLRAGDALARADDALAVELGAKRLAALSAMAKAVRMFEVEGTAAESGGPRSIEEARASALRMRELDEEVGRLIEERARELAAANDAD